MQKIIDKMEEEVNFAQMLLKNVKQLCTQPCPDCGFLSNEGKRYNFELERREVKNRKKLEEHLIAVCPKCLSRNDLGIRRII